MNTISTDQRFTRGDAAMLITTVFWGLGTVLMKSIIGDTPDTLNLFVYNGLRLPVAACMLFSTELLRGGNIRIQRHDYRLFTLASLIGFITTILFLYGLKLTTASNAGVITSTIPLFIVITSFFSGIEKPTVQTIAGIAVGFGGAFVLSWKGGANSANSGDFIILGGCFLMGIFTMFSKKLVAIYSPMVTAGWLFVLSFVWQLPYFIFKLFDQHWSTLPGSIWINFWLSVIGPLFIANTFYYYSLQVMKPSRVGVYTYLIPVFTLFFAYVIRNETITLQQVIGLVIIILGISITKKRVYRRSLY